MADGVNIDWSLAAPKTDSTQSYANAFQLGRQIASPPAAAAVPAFVAADAAPAQASDDRAEGAEPGPAALDIHALSETQRQAAMQHADAMANVLQSLKAIADPAIRLDVARHLAAQTHGAYGIDPRALTAEMVSDPAIDAYTREALGLRGQLEWAQSRAAATGSR